MLLWMKPEKVHIEKRSHMQISHTTISFTPGNIHLSSDPAKSEQQ